ncbi:MAG: RCC1-like domain-containing protein, partial [Flavobacterium sp.]
MLTTYTLSNSNIIHNVGSNSSGQLGLGFSNTITTLINMINSTGKTPSQIACGNSYTIVLMTDGTIYGTGSNSSGQLGDGTTSSKSILTLMINSTGKTPSQIACGSSHTIVLMTDGTIYGTGSNGSGQLGDGTTTSKNILTLMTMPTGKTPSQIACGDNHTIVLMTDGTIYGTGSNGSGQLGDGTTTSKNILTLMTMPTGKTPSQIACGSSHTIVLMTDGTIYGAGFNTSGQLGDGTTTSKRILTEMINTTGKTPSRIACGSSHTIVLMTDGTIYGTGLNGSGQLGDGTNTNKSNLTLMTNSTGKTPLRIACGSSYTIVLMTDGTIYGTGSNSSGQLGDGTTTNKNILTLMNNSTGKTPSQIACGSSHTIVLMTDGTIYGTGNNGSGQLGVLSMLNNLPTLPTGKTPSRIACGGSHTIVLMTDGTIYGTGSNGSGQLGDETTTSKSILTLMINTTGKTPSQIACGDNHTIVLMTDGTIYGTGNNNSGQLGDGTTTNKNTLTLMYNFTGKTPSQIACGSSHTIVLMTDGTIYGTGNNFAGQLGNGTNTSLYILTLMTNSTGKTPSRIACGNSFTIVLMTDGTIYGTGNNDDGQLGDGTTARRTILTFMFNSTGKTPSQIACGSSHTIVLMTDGTIYGTGNNGLGQLGDGTTARRTILTEMTNFTGKTPSQIACGSSHTIVLMTDG